MSAVLSRDGTSIAFDRWGAGPALILVGGALSTRQAAAPLAGLLAPHFTVYGYDRRGRGDSGDTQPYAAEREIEDMGALIAHAGGSASVYGHSSGAALALRAAAGGLAITRLVVYEPPFVVDDRRAPLPPDFAAQLETLLASGRRGDAVALFMSQAVLVPAAMLAQMRQAPIWAGMEKLAHTLPYDMRVMEGLLAGKPVNAKQWAAITAPTLVMAGGASPDWMRNTAQQVALALPHAEHRILAGQNHAVEPAVIAPVLTGFLTT